MKTLKFYPVLLLTLVTLFTACNKDGLSPVKDTPGTGNTSVQLLRIEEDANNYSAFIYNSNGLVSTFTNVDGGNSTAITTTYSADKKAATATGDGQFYKFVYNGTQLDKIEAYQDQAFKNLTSYTQFTYVNNKISQTAIYLKTTGASFNIILKSTFEYNTTGDVKTQKMYYVDPSVANLKLTTSTTYEYDDKLNPMTGIFDFAAVVLGSAPAHNVVKEIIYDANDAIEETNSYIYIYNTAGYPTQAQRKSKPTGAAEQVSTVKFIYK
jgi:hypothetical protein